jgi:hypothetical protein
MPPVLLPLLPKPPRRSIGPLQPCSHLNRATNQDIQVLHHSKSVDTHPPALVNNNSACTCDVATIPGLFLRAPLWEAVVCAAVHAHDRVASRVAAGRPSRSQRRASGLVESCLDPL